MSVSKNSLRVKGIYPVAKDINEERRRQAPKNAKILEGKSVNKISVLIPAFGEGGNLLKLVAALERALQRRDFEILIINDGNNDGSVEVIKELETQHRQVLGLLSNTRRGKTRAIKEGFREATGDLIVLLDADLQYSPGDIPRLVDALERVDVVNGFRVHRKDSIIRKIESRIYNSLLLLFFNVSLQDCNSGLKVFKRKVLEDIIESLKDEWHRYLLVLAIKKGYQVAEIPILHSHRRAGLSKFISPLKLLGGFRDLLSVKAFILNHQLSSDANN